MALPVPAPERGLDRSHLWVALRKGTRVVGRVATPRGRVRWGPVLGIELPYPVPGVEGAEDLFRPHRAGARLCLAPEMEGEIRAGGSAVPLAGLEDWGLVRGRGRRRWVRLTRRMSGTLRYRGLALDFWFGPPPERTAQARLPPVPRRYRRGWIGREEWPFVGLTWALYAVLLGLSLHLGRIPLPPAPEPEAAAQRFARLIYEAPQAPTRVRERLLDRAREEPAEAPGASPEQPPAPAPEAPGDAAREPVTARSAEPAPEPAPPESPRPRDAPAPTREPAPRAPETAPEPSPEPRPGPRGPSREELRKKVAGRGLLGLLSGRGDASLSRRRGSVLQGGGAAADLDRVLDSVKGLQAAPPPGGGGGTGQGSGPAVPTGVDALARRVAEGVPGGPVLEARGSETVEAPGEGDPDGIPLKELVAEIHRAVGAYLGGLRYLYNRALRRNPDLEGKLTVRITIAPDGRVSGCEVVESTLADPDLVKAILARIRRWTLPSAGGRSVTVTYPFVFFPSM